MAFPWVIEHTFELGTPGAFDAESDSDAKLDFPHYSELARTPGLAMPFRGAYCMRIDLAGGTAAAHVQETGDWDLTAGSGDLYQRFMVWISPDLVMANTDEFSLLQWWSSTNTVEAGVYLNFTTANGHRIGIGEATASSFLPIQLGQWITVETFFDPAGASASTLDLWIDGQAATQVGSFTSASITSGVLGTEGIDAGTTKGTILFDQVIADDLQIYPIAERFPREVLMTTSGHVFAGPGKIDNITLMSGAGTDCVVSIFDTDVANLNDASKIVAELKNTANNEVVDPAGMPVRIRRGAYVSMSGTNPRALVQVGYAPAYGSDGAMGSYASRRQEAAGRV